MDADHMKSAQANQLEMIMMLQHYMGEKHLHDYLGGAHDDGQPDGFSHFHHPDYSHFAFPSFASPPASNNHKSPMISFSSSSGSDATDPEPDELHCTTRTASSVGPNHNMAAMREMIFRIAAMQPINIDPEVVKPPKRRNVRISSDPQSVAARHRRERISERIRILQRLVPGGTKMDTASMLDEAIHYMKFLKRQVQSLEKATPDSSNHDGPRGIALRLGFPVAVADHHNRMGYGDNSNNPTSYHYYHHHPHPHHHHQHQVHEPAHSQQRYGEL